MRILVTNDDGVDAPGIRSLAGALHEAGHDVLVVAPSSDWSGSGAAIGKLYDTPPRAVDRITWSDHPTIPVHSLDAPPGTAVLAACLGAFGGLPELVASGVNPGANTGHLVLHSGTVGAALTAASFGIPGIAVSLPWHDGHEYHWDTATSFAVAAVEWAAKPDDGPPRPQPERPERGPRRRAGRPRSGPGAARRGLGGIGRRIVRGARPRPEGTGRRRRARHRRGGAPSRVRGGHSLGRGGPLGGYRSGRGARSSQRLNEARRAGDSGANSRRRCSTPRPGISRIVGAP